MAAQRGNANSSQIGTIYFHGWNTIVMKGSCSASHAESYHFMQIINAHCMFDLPIVGLNRSKHTTLLQTINCAPIKSDNNCIQQIFEIRDWAKQLFRYMKRKG